MAPPAPSSSRRGASRNRALALVGGAVALGGLAWFVYGQLNGGNASGSAQDPGQSSSSRKGLLPSGSKKSDNKPTLSLSLPPTFYRSPSTIRLLQNLLVQLSKQYTVTLIVPTQPSGHASAPNGKAPSESEDVAAAAEASKQSIAQLSQLLENVEQFDTRRILEYSKEDGRLSISRALACDAHCEVMLELVHDGSSTSAHQHSQALFDDEEDEDKGDSEDGDRTPRASSPVPHMRTSATNEASGGKQHVALKPRSLTNGQSHAAHDEALVTALERYHAEVARLRKSSGLLVFVLLPIPITRRQRHAKHADGVYSSSVADIWSLDLESVLKPFLMPGQRDLSARVPGVKVIDERLSKPASSSPTSAKGPQREGKQSATSASNETNGFTCERSWSEAAHRVGRFAHSWT